MSGIMKYDKYQAMVQSKKVEYINGLMKAQSDLISRTLPNRNQVERFLRSLTLTIGSASQKLLSCSPYSIFSSCLNLAYFGLDPSPYLGHAYLIPYNKTATLTIGYKGYVYLMLKSGLFNAVNSEVVYDREEFNLQFGMNRLLVHSPSAPSVRGEAKGAYTTIQYKDDYQDFCYMWLEEINKIRDASRGYNPQEPSGPWLNHPGEMRKKTTIRRIIKLAQFPVGDDRFRIASEVDGSQEAGKDLLKQELNIGVIKDIDGNYIEPDPEPTKDNEITIEAEVTETQPTKPRPGKEEKVSTGGQDKLTPEVQTGGSPIDRFIEKITKEFGVSVGDLYGWFKREKVTTEMGRISKIEQAIELLETGVPWTTISGENRQSAKKKKATEPKPPQEKKAETKKTALAREPDKESPKTIRDRVIALVGGGNISSEKLLVLMKEIFPKLNGESFLNPEWLQNPDFIPNSHIEKMDECFREAGLYS